MNRFLILIVSFILTSNFVNSQNINASVLSSSGDYWVNEKSISFTLGESIVYTNMQNESSIFQGFHNICVAFSEQLFTQTIELPQGWSYWSSYLSPKHSDIEEIFSNIDESLVILKDQYGDVFWPYFGINGIQNHVFGYGYQVKMAEEELLEIQGYKMGNPTIPFFENWNILGYLYENPMPVETVISPIADNIIIIKDELANVYWPFLGINTIDYMLPGEGYAIKLYSDIEFEFPSFENQSRFSNQHYLKPKYYQKIVNTGDNMTIGFSLNILEDYLNYGDEIGVFDSTNKLVGSSIFTNENMAITVWGNDVYSIEKDGMYEGEELIFKIWDNKSQKEKEIHIQYWVEGLGLYNSNGISIAGELLVDTNKESTLQIFPNPVVDIVQVIIDLPYDSPVCFSLFNTIGESEILLNTDLSKGLHSFDFSLQKSSGLYYLTMYTKNSSIISPLSIINR